MLMNLLENTNSGGCTLKTSPSELSKLIGHPFSSDKRILAGNAYNEDAYIIKSGKEQIIQSVDIIAPMISDPYTFGEIAACNSLSDIYAMGGQPISAMNIACFPHVTKDNKETLEAIIEGGKDKLAESGTILAGGHTTVEESIRTLKFGYAVNGTYNGNEYVENSNLKENELLILTKPIGIGLLVSGIKANIFDSKEEVEMYIKLSCTRLNSIGIQLVRRFGVRCCTDITGFGLGGHIIELAIASNKTVHIDKKNIPVLPFVDVALLECVQPERTIQNANYFRDKFSKMDNETEQLLFDPQTSGGLVFSIAEEKYKDVEKFLKNNGTGCYVIGNVLPKRKEMYLYV